ncbi:hypothetical protein C2857_006966 [Epichloe festucae Fl1]|uniref:Pentatricopeptide repeat domain-containing protein n=1 Tax=Epichloe festucae (strain Fl1) TaxID=877507 RepID=A0A7S9KQC4_EPIFF|nr:hypothetical protein C2857_006966 [Epichloe festucae Fl1]
MQSLWARAGRAHRCGCRACSTAVGTTGRRATGVAGRRKATFAEIFTACYSSVFATAAVVDAVWKHDRRKELDRQLEEARRQLSELHERSSDSSPHEATSSDLTIQQKDSLWRTLKGIYQDRPYMKELHKPATVTASELISSLKTEFYNAVGEPSLRAMRKTNYEKLERAIATDVLDGQLRLREPRNYAQLLQVSLSTEQLVQQLLRRTEIIDNGATHSPAFDEARQLVTKGYPNFSFPSIDPERAAKNSSLLNSQIRALTSAENLSFKERIGRVCYNLLVSAYPPDTHTYNTLIVAFDKSGHHALSDVMVFSFFHQRLMKPTPSTYAAIVNHYKSTNNHGQFLRVISCLAGLDKLTGAKIRRRHINDVAQMPDLQKWAADLRRRTRTGQWVWEHGPLSTTLVETILDGLLHFKLFADAATLFITCVRSGVALSTRTMTHLFDECVAALDWKAAVRMVRGLMFILQEWENLLSQTDCATAAHLLSRTSALIDLCGLGSNGQKPSKKRLANLYISAPKRNRFLESMAEANQLFAGMELEYYHTPRKGPRDELLGFKRRLLQIESLWKEYEHVQKTTSSIESKLLYPQFSTSFRTSMALHIGANAVRRSLELCQKIENALPSTELPMGRPLVSSHATKNVEDQSLTREMDSLTVDAKHFGIHLEPRPREVSSTSTAMTGCARKQGHALPKEPDYKPGGLLAWSRQPNRAGSVETRHWAIGS